MRKRLRKKIDKKDIKLLTALFDRLEHYNKGVDGEGFRIDFKDRRKEIDGLIARSCIRESYEPVIKIYRPTLLALSLIDDPRAEAILVLVDRLVRYFAQRYETTRSQAITLKEMSEALAVPQDAVANALGYIIEGPASGGRTSALPDGPEWQFMPGSNALDFPNLDAVLAQLSDWSAPPRSLRSWIGQHRKTAAAIGGGLAVVIGLAGDALDVFAAIARLFGGS
jgi:hypothetical protein